MRVSASTRFTLLAMAAAMMAPGPAVARGHSIQVIWRQADPCADKPKPCRAPPPVIDRIVMNGAPLNRFHDIRRVPGGMFSLKVYCPTQPQGPSEIQIRTAAPAVRMWPASEGCGVMTLSIG